jgi:C1A family cysteine protease
MSRSYGWKRDLPTHPDNYLSVAHHTVLAKFPPSKFLPESFLPAVFDQGQISSCTSNSLGAAFEYEQKKQGLTDFTPSRLFIYYNERLIENSVSADSGAALSDGIKVLTDIGVCPESIWPYDVSKYADMPTDIAFTDAKPHKILGSKPVPVSIHGIKTMINMGYPVAFGFSVFDSFQSQRMADTGIMTMPARTEQLLGGHAVMMIGYSDTMQAGHHTGFIKVRNSWGDKWGQKGSFWMPYDYIIAGLTSDYWVITQNEADLVSENKKMTEPI